MSEIQIKIGERIPEEIVGNDIPKIAAFWLNDNMNILICDCQNKKEVELFSKSKIDLSISKIHGVLFFLVNINDISLQVDVPYNPNLTPLTKEEIQVGFVNIYIYFANSDGIIEAIRGIKLGGETRKTIGNLFASACAINNMEEYYNKITEIYKRYSTEEISAFRVLDIDWKYNTDFN